MIFFSSVKANVDTSPQKRQLKMCLKCSLEERSNKRKKKADNMVCVKSDTFQVICHDQERKMNSHSLSKCKKNRHGSTEQSYLSEEWRKKKWKEVCNVIVIQSSYCSYDLDIDDNRDTLCDEVAVSSQCSQEKDMSSIVSAEVNENSEICEISKSEHNLKDEDNENAFQRHPGKEIKMNNRKTNQGDVTSPIIPLKGLENHDNVENCISNANNPENLGLTSVKNDLIIPFQHGSMFSTPVEIQVNYLEAMLHIHGIPWKYMNNEWYRLMSFVKFPRDSHVSAIRLASKGFAYLNKESEQSIICCFCTTQLKTFNDMNNIDEEHERLGPDCPMVKGTHSNNVSMEQQCPDMNVDEILSKLQASRQNESQMKQSYASAATPLPLSQDDDSNGVRSSQPSDESAPYVFVTNFSDITESDGHIQNSGLSGQPSQIVVDSASPQDQEAVTSQFSSVPQSTITNNSEPVQSSSTVENSTEQQDSSQEVRPEVSENAGDATSYEKLGIITSRPKRVEFAVYLTRLNSFNAWPKDHHMKPVDLAKAGYFYTGYSDCARCFYCGGGLRNWEPRDDVWVEHARWFPKCAFLLQEVGKGFIEAVQAMSKERDEIKYADVIQRLQGSAALTPLKFKQQTIERDPAVMSVIDNGFDKDQITKLAQEIRKSGEVLSSDKLYEAAKARNFPQIECSNNLGSDSVSIRKGGNEKRDKDTIETLRTEINEFRQQTTCKICMDMEVAIAFLPCGHLVSCTECSCAMTVCPVCRFGIKGIVRAYVG